MAAQGRIKFCLMEIFALSFAAGVFLRNKMPICSVWQTARAAMHYLKWMIVDVTSGFAP